MGESSQEVPAEVLRSPPPHILRAPAPLIPEPRAPSSDSDPHVPLADSDLRVPPADSGPHVLPIGSAPRSPTADSAPRASADGSGAGRPLAEPETTGTPGGYRLPDPAGGEGPSRGWPRAAIAVCAALLVTAVVLLTLVIPTLNRSDALPGPQAGGPPVPAKSRPATSKPPATSEPPTAKQSQGPREPVIDPPVAPPPTVAIPLLAGLDKGAASKAVKKAGLVLGPVTRVDSPRRIGQVLSSRPASGTFARKGSTVSLQVSAGLAVPAVAGMQRRAAEAALTGAGLTVGAVTRSCSAEPNGRVLSSTPKAGRRVQGGTAVSLTVALKGATAPAVVGQAREDARAALSAAGFTVQTKDQVVEDESQVGTVLAQSVQPGVCGAAGSPVVITVGVAAPPDPGEPTETPTAPIAGE
ncbi:PASTA domain-containing protein [Nonomuraea sp. NPDC050643]|uniref:PASTA domain-containing protein n=1 Tax=Nonomuraea sp. NPDC050643 TaxID=3155660 RepID=UPI00340FE3A8